MENYTSAEVTENYTPEVEESKLGHFDACFEFKRIADIINDRLTTIDDRFQFVDDRLTTIADRLIPIADRFQFVDDRVQIIVNWVKDNNFVHEIESFINDRFDRIEQLFGQSKPSERVYVAYRDVEDQLRVLAPFIVFRTQSDFNPEVNPTGRLSRLPADARLIAGADLVNRIVPSKEWDQFLALLLEYPTTIWRDPRDRDGSNTDYIILVFHPEGVIYIRMRAVE